MTAEASVAAVVLIGGARVALALWRHRSLPDRAAALAILREDAADLIRLPGRLRRVATDPHTPRRARWLLVALADYVASRIDPMAQGAPGLHPRLGTPGRAGGRASRPGPDSPHDLGQRVGRALHAASPRCGPRPQPFGLARSLNTPLRSAFAHQAESRRGRRQGGNGPRPSREPTRIPRARPPWESRSRLRSLSRVT
jgi:hypothetical protein